MDSGGATFTFLADVGFAMLMFIAGTHVPIRDRRLLTGLPRVVPRLAVVVVAAVGLGAVVGRAFGTDHALLYAVLFASSSAAIILPVVDGQQLTGAAVLQPFPRSPLLIRRASLPCRWSSTPPTPAGRPSAPP